CAGVGRGRRTGRARDRGSASSGALLAGPGGISTLDQTDIHAQFGTDALRQIGIEANQLARLGRVHPQVGWLVRVAGGDQSLAARSSLRRQGQQADESEGEQTNRMTHGYSIRRPGQPARIPEGRRAWASGCPTRAHKKTRSEERVLFDHADQISFSSLGTASNR